jgi:hypothetical protein
MKNSSKLRSGDWVQVRSKEEILGTLDDNGQLEGLPFMPEMFEFCGKQFRVFKRAHKTCDPPNGLKGRRMLGAVHLEGLRCSGSAHGGCQARCLVFWKEAWLKAIDGAETSSTTQPHRPSNDAEPKTHRRVCSEEQVVAGARRPEMAGAKEPVYVCQSTQVKEATEPLAWWDLSQYVEDCTSGNVRLPQLLGSFLLFVYSKLVSSGLGVGSGLRWIYDSLQRALGGTPYPWRAGKVTPGLKTPSTVLNLQPGELVQVRSYEEILQTITAEGHNRGMVFDAEMVPYCGGTYRVLDRVHTIINEKTGKMQHLKNDCVILEEVVCLACYAKYRKFCPRSIYPFWREIWLSRLQPKVSPEG